MFIFQSKKTQAAVNAHGNAPFCVQIKNHWNIMSWPLKWCSLFSHVTCVCVLCVCVRLCWRDFALNSIIIQTKDARALTDRPRPTASMWVFVLKMHRLCSGYSPQACNYTCVLAHVARLCVSGSRPSEAYYQDVTDDGRQQPQHLNESWTLANWWHHGVRERERQLPGRQEGKEDAAVPSLTLLSSACHVHL